jgi:hypothetical protein
MSRRYEDEDPIGEWEFREDLRIARELASRRPFYPVPSAIMVVPEEFVNPAVRAFLEDMLERGATLEFRRGVAITAEGEELAELYTLRYRNVSVDIAVDRDQVEDLELQVAAADTADGEAP